MSKKRLLQVFQGQPTDRPPFWFMRQAGRYLPEYQALRRKVPDFLTFCYTPDVAIEAALQPLRRFRMDAAILFSDILIIPDALGCEVSFVEGQGPMLTPVRSPADMAKLTIDRLDEHLQPVFETVRGLAGAISPETALIGFAGAPWTLAVYMVEGRGGTSCETARLWGYSDPKGFGRLIRLLIDAVTACLQRQIEHGAEVVQLFDSWAGVLSELEFHRWVIEPTREIVGRVRTAHPEVPIIGFPRGAGVLCSSYVEQTGIDGIGIDAGVSASWAAEALQKRCVVQGNLDNCLLAAGGEDLQRETRRILGTLGAKPFVFNLGHGILPHTPVENVAVVADIVRSWR